MSAKNILIVPQNWLGDIVMAQTLLKKIKNKNKSINIDVLVEPVFEELINRMPEANRAIVLNCKHSELGLGKRFRLAKQLSGTYDQSIVLSRSIKSALIPYLAKIPIRTGERGESRYILINDLKSFSREDRRKTAYRYVSMYSEKEELDEKYFPTLEADPENTNNLISNLGLKLDKKIVIFAPGAAFGPSKMWPVNKFKELGSKLENNFLILILGSKNEAHIGEQIANGQSIISLCGKTSIKDAIDLMHISEFCVSNDSGLMHLASATKTKSISIYGATSPDLTPPLTNNKEIHYVKASCSPCFEKICKYGHYNCLVEIQADDVFKSFK